MAAGVVDRAGGVLLRQVAATAADRGGGAVLADAQALVGALAGAAAAAGRPVAGLGIGICELVDPQGNVRSRYTVDWQDLPVAEAFAEALGVVVVEADVRAHALAEAAVGAGQGLDSFVYVSVGSGISSCLVLAGRPFAGARGNALVLATMPVMAFDAEERPLEFALEPFASGVGMVSRFQRYEPRATRVEEIVAAAAAGNADAARILRTGGEALGSALAWLVNVLDPQALVVGGGLGLAGGLYWEHALASLRAHVYADDSREVPVLTSGCGPDAGLIGAALRVFAA
jgi:glucokinase